MNGRMDLTQAEAVIDLIEAETAQAARNAVEQLGGALRRRIDGVYEDLLEVASRFYAVVDYPDEDIEDVGPEEIVMQPEEVVDFCWVGQSQYRRMEREGLLHPALKNFFTTYREKIPRGNPFRKHLRR